MAFKGKDSSDWVVGQVWGYSPGRLRLFDLVRGHWGLGETLDQVRALSKKWKGATTKLIEDAANGPGVVDLLQGELFGLELVDPQGGKLSRAWASEPAFRSGNVEMPPPEVAPWLDDYIAEMTRFTGAPGATDDQVDSTTQAIVHFLHGNTEWLERIVEGGAADDD
jgi:predicted phage terminase large subunit-like protein